MFLPVFVCLFVCLSVCQQHNSKSYGRIFLKFWGYVGHGINYQWFSFGRDLEGILDSGSLWNFRYHCIKGGIREPLAKRRWWRHLANSFALAEVPAGYDCFLVFVFFLNFKSSNAQFLADHTSTTVELLLWLSSVRLSVCFRGQLENEKIVVLAPVAVLAWSWGCILAQQPEFNVHNTLASGKFYLWCR